MKAKIRETNHNSYGKKKQRGSQLLRVDHPEMDRL
jgi:hypothetical protein